MDYKDEGNDKDVVIIFEPLIKEHPDFYMEIEGCYVQPWSLRWPELCIMKALSYLEKEVAASMPPNSDSEKDTELALEALKEVLKKKKMSDLLGIIRKNKIIKVCPPAYIPIEYFKRVYVRGHDFMSIDEEGLDDFCSRVEILKTENPLNDACLAMPRLQLKSGGAFPLEQSYSFGLEPCIKNFVVRSVYDTYRFVCYQEKVDLIISFPQKLGHLTFDEKGMTIKRQHEKEEENVKMDMRNPECGIEYVLTVKEKAVTVKCNEIFYVNIGDKGGAPSDGKEDKFVIQKKPVVFDSGAGLSLEKVINFKKNPVYLKLKTKTYASVNNYTYTYIYIYIHALLNYIFIL